MTAKPSDPLALLERIAAHADRLLGDNHALRAEVADLRDQLEGLSTKLTAQAAENLTLTREAEAAELRLANANSDTQRLERLRAELDRYLGEIDRRLHPPAQDARPETTGSRSA